MKAKILASLIAVLIVAASFVVGEGTVTETKYEGLGGSIWRVEYDWTTSTNSWASLSTGRLVGTVVRVSFDPDTTSPPAAAYDVTLTDEDGIDILAGLGANLASNAASSTVPGVPTHDGTGSTNMAPFAINGVLDLIVTNAGSETVGEIVIYLKR